MSLAARLGLAIFALTIGVLLALGLGVREAWRVARQGILLSDLHRNPLVYMTLWFVLRAQRHGGPFYADALLSVKRGWRLRELQALVADAEIPNARVELFQNSRVVLPATKSPR